MDVNNTSSNPCSVDNFPFFYYNEAGTKIDGALNSDGFCIFENANCSPNVSANTCCEAKADLTEDGSNYMFIAFIFILLPSFFLKSLKKKKNDQLRAEGKEVPEDPFKIVPSWVEHIPLGLIRNLVFKLWRFGLIAFIVAQVIVPIFMRASIQQEMLVSERNALIAAEAFLIPFAEIFQFIEDVVLVRVNYAMGRNDRALTNQLVHAGISGALVTGTIAAIIATILGVIPPVLRALTNPGLNNDQTLYPSCEFIESINAKDVLPYWLFESWAMSGTQIGMCMSGFMYGAKEFNLLGWIGALSVGLIPLIWYLAKDQSSNLLLLLGSAEFAAAFALPVISILYLVSPLGIEIRERTGVTLTFSQLFKSVTHSFSSETKDVGIMEQGTDTKEGKHQDYHMPKSNEKSLTPQMDTKSLLIEGFKIMFMDVAIQACMSLTIYLALVKDAAIGYQLTALQSALPTYGIAYALGMGIIMKVFGAQLVAKKSYETFAIYAKLTILCAFLLVPLIVGAVIPFHTEMAFEYGNNACTYAKDSQCVPFFNKIFGENAIGGQHTLPFTFEVFAYGASVEAVFFVLRATMLACLDLNYMLWCTIIAVIIYIPAICIATLVQPFAGEASAFFVAAFIPQVVLIFAFLFRIFVNLKRMLNGEEGPWSKEDLGHDSTKDDVPQEAVEETQKVEP